MKKVVIAMLAVFVLSGVSFAQNIPPTHLDGIADIYYNGDVFGSRTREKEAMAAARKRVEVAAAIAEQNAKALNNLEALYREHANDQYGGLLKGIVSKYKELISGKSYEASFENTVNEVLANLRALKGFGDEGSQIATRVESILKTAKYQYKHDHYIFTRSSGWITWKQAQQVHWEVKRWHSVG